MSFIFSKTISILYFRISSNAPIQKLQQGQKKDVVASIPNNIGEKFGHFLSMFGALKY